MHTPHIMGLQEVTTKARGQIHSFEREVALLCVEGHTVIHQLRQELDDRFRNEMEKIRNNELVSLGGLLKEMECGENKQLTSSISTMMKASEQGIQQELVRDMTRKRD